VRHLVHIGRVRTTEKIDRFLDFESVTDRATERRIHARYHAHTALIEPAGYLDEMAGEHFGVFGSLHERALPRLHVENKRIRPSGDLLRKNACRDERHAVDEAPGIPQRVDLCLDRTELAERLRDRGADLSDLSRELVAGKLDANPWYAREFVDGSAGVPEGSSRKLRHVDAERSYPRNNDEGNGVANTTGAVLVDKRAHVI